MTRRHSTNSIAATATPQLVDRSYEKSFAAGDATLFLGDAIDGMAGLPDQSFDLAIVDPPYGASTQSLWHINSERRLPGMGGAWKLADHEWDRLEGVAGFQFALAWLWQLRRLVRPTGSIWIHSTYHNAGIANICCQILGLEIINEVVWCKPNAFPNLSGRRLTASHETILWVHTGKEKRQYRFNYEEAKAAKFPGDPLKMAGKQLRTVWVIPNNKQKEELQFGQHPTQKPLRVLNRMLMISGKPGGACLVPFMGSGSEVIASLRYGMKAVGFEIDSEYFGIAKRRVTAEMERREKCPQFSFTSRKDE